MHKLVEMLILAQLVFHSGNLVIILTWIGLAGTYISDYYIGKKRTEKIIEMLNETKERKE